MDTVYERLSTKPLLDRPDEAVPWLGRGRKPSCCAQNGLSLKYDAGAQAGSGTNILAEGVYPELKNFCDILSTRSRLTNRSCQPSTKEFARHAHMSTRSFGSTLSDEAAPSPSTQPPLRLDPGVGTAGGKPHRHVLPRHVRQEEPRGCEKTRHDQSRREGSRLHRRRGQARHEPGQTDNTRNIAAYRTSRVDCYVFSDVALLGAAGFAGKGFCDTALNTVLCIYWCVQEVTVTATRSAAPVTRSSFFSWLRGNRLGCIACGSAATTAIHWWCYLLYLQCRPFRSGRLTSC